MDELERIVAAARQAREEGIPSAMATILGAEGSSFRRPGARRWLSADAAVGSVSAGCLERDLAERAAAGGGRPAVVSYDTGSAEDVLWGTASGCGGRLEILLEPVTAELVAELAWVVAERERRRRAALITVWNGANVHRVRLGADAISFDRTPPEVREAVGEGRMALESGRTRFGRIGEEALFLAEVHHPPFALTLFGDGADAVETLRLAEGLGWRLPSVASVEGAVANGSGGASASDSSRIVADARAALLVMTHNFHRDIEVLRAYGRLPFGYIGVVGPRRRTEALLREAGIEAASLAALRAPAGLDLGGETPAELALSLVSEIQTTLAGRPGGPLRDRRGPIHEPADQVAHANLPGSRR